MIFQRTLEGIGGIGVLFLLDRMVNTWVVRWSDVSWLCNVGGVWGVILPTFLFYGALIAVIAAAIVSIRRGQARSIRWGWYFVVAGGFGNTVDRLVRGCVVDYVDVPFLPLFNVADVWLTMGTLLLAYRWWRQGNNREEANPIA